MFVHKINGIRKQPKSKIYMNKHVGNTVPTNGDNVSVKGPFDDPVGPPPRPPYQQRGAPYSPVTRPQGTMNAHVVECQL